MSQWRTDVDLLLSAEQIHERVVAMGGEITRDYQDKELCIIGILRGCFVFYADLVRHIDLPVTCEFIGISSYGDATESTGVVQITSDLSSTVEGKHLLVVEDIVDTGLSMKYLLENLQTRHPASTSVCSLLVKPDNARVKVGVAYKGFDIPNEFVVGYGLDVAGKFRNLPYIGVYRG